MMPVVVTICMTVLFCTMVICSAVEKCYEYKSFGKFVEKEEKKKNDTYNFDKK